MQYEENPVITNIKTRRSVRDYLDTPLNDEVIGKIIDAGRYAPTGMGLQPWQFIVITNRDLLKKLSDHIKPILVKNLEGKTDEFSQIRLKRFKAGDYDLFYNAPVLVLVTGSENNPFTDIDATLCAQNMMLAAHSLGLGSCWMGSVGVIQQDEGLLSELKVPKGHRIVAPLIFGYPRTIPETPEKREPVVIWIRQSREKTGVR